MDLMTVIILGMSLRKSKGFHLYDIEKITNLFKKEKINKIGIVNRTFKIGKAYTNRRRTKRVCVNFYGQCGASEYLSL